MPVLEVIESEAQEQAVDTQADVRRRALTAELFEDIQAEAYRLWQDRGSPHGSDWSDWFAAEEKLLSEAYGA